MNFLKEYFSDKKYGFYVVLGTMLMSIITMIVYVAGYSKTRYMSWVAFALLIIACVITAALLVFKMYKLAPAALLACNFLSLLCFIYYIYFFVSSVMTGIQFSAFPPEFMATVIFYGITLVSSVACVFMPMVKDKEESE